MDTILKLMAGLSRADAGPGMDPSPAVATPADAADPSAVAEFSKIMGQGNAPDMTGGSPVSQGSCNLTPVADTGYANPATLGEKMAQASSIDGMEPSETSATRQWLNTITDIFDKEALSYPDLYRVQVLAGMAQIEVTRNSSVAKGMDESLKTLVKNT